MYSIPDLHGIYLGVLLFHYLVEYKREKQERKIGRFPERFCKRGRRSITFKSQGKIIVWEYMPKLTVQVDMVASTTILCGLKLDLKQGRMFTVCKELWLKWSHHLFLYG